MVSVRSQGWALDADGFWDGPEGSQHFPVHRHRDPVRSALEIHAGCVHPSRCLGTVAESQGARNFPFLATLCYPGPVQDLPSGLIELSVLGTVMNGFVCRGAASPLSQRPQLFTPWQGEVLTDTKHKQIWRKGLFPGFSRKKSTEPSVWAVVNTELFRLGKAF